MDCCGESIISPALYVPNVSVKVEITSLVGARLAVKGTAVETINFNVKAKLEEKERKSQMVLLGFTLSLATKPNIVRFDVEGTATLSGKDTEINKMLEVDPETKVPYVFQKIYQYAFTAMYLLSTILNAPQPPHDLLLPHRDGVPVEDISVEVAAEVMAPPSEKPQETGAGTVSAPH